MKDFVGIIYRYTSPNNKSYIGQTRNECRRRQCWFDISRPYAGKKLEQDRIAFGPENFKYEILFKVESQDEDLLVQTLNEKEQYFINLYNTCNNGYNSNSGGCNYVISEDQLKARCIPILQYDLDGNFVQEWDSAKTAEEQTGIKACNIALVLKNIRYQTGGFIFRYKTEDFSYKIPITPNSTQKKIICKYDLEDNLLQEFESINAAAENCGVGRDCIRLYINGKNNHIYRGYKWRRKYE